MCLEYPITDGARSGALFVGAKKKPGLDETGFLG
jgi:hypothetical protein